MRTIPAGNVVAGKGRYSPNIDPLDCLSMRMQRVLVWVALHEFMHQAMREIRAVINDIRSHYREYGIA